MRYQWKENSATVGLAPVGTAVVWVGCLIVGMTGVLMPVIPRAAPVKKLSPVQATLIHVELSRVASPAPNAIPPPQMPQPAAPPQALAPSAAPPMTAVALPSPAIAFALPTSGPTRVVSAAEAAPTRLNQENQKAVAAPPNVQRITYGEGEGQQPKPEYPPEAKIARQQGVVLIRFTIGEDGRVTSADAIEPCPFPMLNQSALRTIREDWRFSPGPVREREISIEFDLKQR